MERFEQKINELEQRLNHRFDRAVSRATSFILLVMALILGGFVLLAYRANLYLSTINERVGTLETTVSTSPAPNNQNSPPQSNANGSLGELETRLTVVEKLQDTIASTSKGALDQMNLVFGITASFFGLFSLFLAYRQNMIDASNERREGEMLGLVSSTRENIGVINDLIASLKESYSYREEVDSRIQEMNKQLSEIEKYKIKAERSLQDQITELNTLAFSFFRSPITRENFKIEENRGKLENFYVNMNALERMGDVAAQFSPICYFLKALHFFNVTQYDLASDDLEEAYRFGVREIAKPSLDRYSDANENEVSEQLNRMLTDCSYHLGIIYYNLGEYDKARERFQEACKRNRLDFRSRSYIPELMYFDTRIPLTRTIAEFSAVEKELKNLSIEDRQKLDWSAAMASLKMREGNCYLPKAIPLLHRAGYRSTESAERAASIYWEAYDHVQKFETRSTLTEIFVRLSLAQALEHLGRPEWRGVTPTELFQQVFYDVRKQVALKTEPILLLLLNYVLAICLSRAAVIGENPRSYLARSREQLQRIPTQVLIFSPINKINLHRDEIIAEMETFEKSLL